jgi:hypothetical protein
LALQAYRPRQNYRVHALLEAGVAGGDVQIDQVHLIIGAVTVDAC